MDSPPRFSTMVPVIGSLERARWKGPCSLTEDVAGHRPRRTPSRQRRRRSLGVRGQRCRSPSCSRTCWRMPTRCVGARLELELHLAEVGAVLTGRDDRPFGHGPTRRTDLFRSHRCSACSCTSGACDRTRSRRRSHRRRRRSCRRSRTSRPRSCRQSGVAAPSCTSSMTRSQAWSPQPSVLSRSASSLTAVTMLVR